jgi:transposase
MIELVRVGRDPTDLAREFEPSAQAIRSNVYVWRLLQADLVEGRREAKSAMAAPALSAAERDELARPRREMRQLRVERDILSRAAAWFARETGMIPSGSSGSWNAELIRRETLFRVMEGCWQGQFRQRRVIPSRRERVPEIGAWHASAHPSWPAADYGRVSVGRT